jgi:hypothetical protein
MIKGRKLINVIILTILPLAGKEALYELPLRNKRNIFKILHDVRTASRKGNLALSDNR